MPKLVDDPITADPRTAGYFEPIIDSWWQHSRILIVLDGGLSISADNDFGISMAIAHIRGFKTGFASFSVTLARREGFSRTNIEAGPEDYTYTGFRFDQREGSPLGPYTLHKYDQVWLFGFFPGNGPKNDPNDLSATRELAVDKPEFHPTSEGELKVLSQWMDAGGGVFAAGDHHQLGASMCKRIPRVSTMRRWLATDGVPTRNGNTRFDTRQPLYYDEYEPTPQPIRWVPVLDSYLGPLPRHAPHPILCHPQHGPIDVLPGHMHEGRCYDPGDFEWHVEYAHTTDKFGDYRIEHYPSSDGVRPLPQAIAFGTTLGTIRRDGPQPFRETPLIVAYDGQRVSRGRVVVDSTWHHWFDLNLKPLDKPEVQIEREKIFRFYANVAIWLASPNWRSGALIGEIKREQFRYFGREQFSAHLESAQLGSVARELLNPRIGPCWVWNLAEESFADIGVQIQRTGSGLWPHLNGSSRDYFCSMFVGEMVKLAYADQPETELLIADGQLKPTRIFEEDPLHLAREAARRASAAIAKAWRKEIVSGETLLKLFEAAGTSAVEKNDRRKPTKRRSRRRR